MANSNTWSRLNAPPPRLFTGEKENNLVKQINTELEERVLGQQILYYSLDVERSNYHLVYGEAIEKTGVTHGTISKHANNRVKQYVSDITWKYLE